MSDVQLETWDDPVEGAIALHVRVTFPGGEAHQRVLRLARDEDWRLLRQCAEQMGGVQAEESDRIPAGDKAAFRRVHRALLIETLFPDLYHDPRLPA